MLGAFDGTLYLQFFIGMMALLNPFGLMPVFIGLTAHQEKQARKQTLNVAMITVFISLVLLMLTGQTLLELFGISMASFRIAGGVMLLMIALSMLKGELGEVRQNKEENQQMSAQDSVAVVPLAIPAIAGPGAMSTVVLYAAENYAFQHLLAFSAMIFILCVFCWVTFRCAPLLEKAMGNAGINVVTRLMGLIIVALSVEFMATGVKELFPILA